MKKNSYEIKQILSISVMQEITEKNDKISTRFIQTLAAQILHTHAENLPLLPE